MASPNIRSVGTSSETAPAWSTHVAGDKGYRFVHSEAANVSTPAGWTLVDGFPVGNGAGNVFIYVFEKTAASSSEAAVTLTGGTVPFGFIIAVQNAWGCIASAAMGATGAVTTGICPSIRAPVDATLVLNVLAWALDSAGALASSWTNASLTSFAEQFDSGTVTNGGGGITLAAGTLAAAGKVDPATVTLTSTQFASGTLVIAPSGQNTFSGTVTIDGSPAPNTSSGSPKVYLYDKTQPLASVLVTAVDITGGSGAYSASVPYSDHTYIPIYERDVAGVFTMCAGAPSTSGTGKNITHNSSGGGGLKVPSAGATYVR